MTVELASDDIEPYLDRSYKRVVNRVDIPGFRRGKAPRYIVETYMGRDAMVRESLDFILQESLEKALEEESLEVFGEPEVDLVETDPLSFKALVPLEPMVDLGEFRSLRLEPEPADVTTEQVDETLEQMRYQSAPWQPSENPVKFGDLVTLDVGGTIEGNTVANDKGVDFIPSMENPYPFPGFSVYLEGMKKDDSKEFTLPVPEDYADESLAGKECRFQVKALEIKEKILPELDDEFAKGAGEGFDTVDELRANVLERLSEEAKRASLRSFQDRVLEEVISGASVEVSELTTNREIDYLIEEQAHNAQGRHVDIDTYLKSAGKSKEELREELRPAALERLSRFLTIRRLAQEEGIEVPPEDIDTEVEKLTSGQGESMESLRQALSSDRSRSSIGNAILTRKVLEAVGEIVQGQRTEEDGDSDGAVEQGIAEEEVEMATDAGSEDDSAVPSQEGADTGEVEAEGGSEGDDRPA